MVTTVENNIKYNNEIKENETIETIFLKVDFSKIKKEMELKTANVLNKIQLCFQELNWPFIDNFGKRESSRPRKKKD